MKSATDPYGIRHVQEQTFAILQYLDEVCRQLGLTYYLAYGTLLGAVRHQGFIPWDDDVDVWMQRQDYMKLLDYLRTSNPDARFVLNDGPYKPEGDRPAELQMRLLDLSGTLTRTYAGKSLDVHPWIDIFALDSFPIGRKDNFLKKFKRNLFMYKIARCKSFVVRQNSFFGKMNRIVYTLHKKFKLFFFISEERCLKRVVRNLTKYKDLQSEEYFCYAAVYLPKPEKCFFSAEWFGIPKELVLEDGVFFAPCNSHEVLTRLYSSYMELPPESERRPTHGVRDEE